MKIKEKQLKKIQEQQTKLNDLLNKIGVLEANKHGLLHEMAGVNQDIEEFKKELEEEYGAVNINLEDGSYTEIETEIETPVAAV
jgi:predicted  nucleic acid-binding Zn-ribbon protein